MTREEAKQLLPIIQAYAEGKTIQVRYSTNRWEDMYVPHFNDPASKATEGLVEDLEPKVKKIQELFPMRLSEAEPKK